MGTLKHIDIAGLMATYGLTAFVETGTSVGDGLAYAATFPFEQLDSVELIWDDYKRAEERFQHDRRIRLWSGSSPQALDLMLPLLESHRILFWLDAHLPQYYDGRTYDRPTTFPAQQELDVISHWRAGEDVIVIDDLRLFESGPYESGLSVNQLFEGIRLPENSVVERDYADEGYLLIKPKI